MVHGQVVCVRGDGGRPAWRFWLSNTVAANTRLFEDAPPIPRLSDVPPSRQLDAELLRAPGRGGDCAECADNKNNAIRAAGRAYDRAITQAVAERNADIAAAHQAYEAAKAAAENTLAVTLGLASTKITACLIGCAFAGPAAPACVAGCGILYSATVAAALAQYGIAVTKAAEQRDAAINAANTVFDAAVNAAEESYTDAVNAANAAYAACIQGCGGGGPPRQVYFTE